MYAVGYAGMELDGRGRRVHISEVLPYEERKIYTFGTTDYGQRDKLVGITKITDKDGNVVGQYIE